LTKNILVSEVCYSVGFDSVTSFTALFKKLVGPTPSAFQQQQKKRNTDIATSPLHFIPNCFAETHGWIKNSNFQEVLL